MAMRYKGEARENACPTTGIEREISVLEVSHVFSKV